MKTILVAVDFSDVSAGLVEKAAEMATGHESKVYIIHIAAPDPEFIGYKVGPEYIRQTRADELRGEKKELEKYAEKLRLGGVDAVPLLVQGATADMLLVEAERLDAGLLIMGTHGHGPALAAILGSTSYQVLKRASRPVLLMPCRDRVEESGQA